MNSDTLPVWKKIYQTVSWYNINVTTDFISDVLRMCQPRLVKGLADYKPYSRQSYEKWQKTSKLDDQELSKFIHKISIELDLEVDITWDLLCNFLMFEYYGKVTELKSIIKYETEASCLIKNIWHFYTSERCYVIKTFKLIIELSEDESHDRHKQFNDFVKNINFTEVWNNLTVVFKNLIGEIDQEKAEKSHCLENWILRNIHEQTEVLVLMMHVIKYLKVDGSEFTTLLRIFLSHSFARHSLHHHERVILIPEETLKVKYTEIGCLLMLAKKYWETPEVFKILPLELEKDLEILDMQEENGVVLLLWCILKYSVTETSEALEYCNDVLAKLTSRNIFQSLYLLMSHPMFEKSKFGYLLKEAINKLMYELLKMVDDYGNFYILKGVIPVISNLMQYEDFKARLTFGPIIKCALDSFPLDFYSLLTVSKSLLTHHFQDICCLLINLPTFLSDIEWHSARGHEQTIPQNNSLFEQSKLITIPGGTKSDKFVYNNEIYLRYHFSYNFFTLMEQYINDIVALKRLDLVPKVCLAYDLIVDIIKHLKSDISSIPGLTSCIKKLESIALYNSHGYRRHKELSETYFSVYFTLIIEDKFKFEDMFSRSVRNTIFNNTNIDQLSVPDLYRVKLTSMSALHLCLQNEEASSNHSFLLLYIKFIKKMVTNKEYMPMGSGIWYLLNYVFPHYTKWTYANKFQMAEIGRNCLSIFIYILQMPDNMSKQEKKMFELIVYGFLNEEWLIKIFVTSLVKDKYCLQKVMESDPDWITGPSSLFLDALRVEMTFILLLLKQRQLFSSHKPAINDWMEILARSVSAYLVNGYSVHLTKLCCRFLEIVARDNQLPLLAVLGLDQEQVQRLFLDRLRDPIEDEDVKYYIIELVNTCISCQNGMTAAFFNVPCSKKWYISESEKPESSSLGEDTVSDFMIDYLQNIKKTPEYLKNPLQLGILKVMCTLWEEQKEHLIHDVTTLDQFWSLLSDPFWKKFDNKPTVYNCILKIFNLELYYNHYVENGKFLCTHKRKKCNFEDAITKFLTNKDNLKLWFQYLLDSFKDLPKSDNETMELIHLVKSWSGFLVLIEEKLPDFFKNYDFRQMTIELCLDILKINFPFAIVIETWMDLCLLFLSKWASSIKKQDAISVIDKVICICKPMRMNYNFLSAKSRQSFLCSIYSIIKSFKQYFEGYPEKLIELLTAFDYVVDYEYYMLYETVIEKLKAGQDRESLRAWGLIILIANTLISMSNCKCYSVWLHYKEYFNKVLISTPDLTKFKQTQTLAKMSIHSLTLYIESPLGNDKMHVSLTKFFDEMETPVRSLLLGDSRKINFAQLQDGWFFCTLLIKFNLALMVKFHDSAFQTCLMFLSLNESMLQHIFTLIEATVDLNALDLVINTLFVLEMILINWDKYWDCKSSIPQNIVVGGVKKIINSSISAILRPKNISFHSLNELDTSGTPDLVAANLMVLVMNKLIQIIGHAFNCLYKISPPLLKMLSPLENENVVFDLVINDFSVPNFEAGVDDELTYGRLLCIAHFLCKTLNQIEQKQPKTCYEIDVSSRDGLTNYIGLIEYQNKVDNFQNQKLSAFLRFAMSEYSGLSEPWITELNHKHVKDAFEILMMFLGGQAFLAVLTMEPQDLSYYQRNLCSELQFFTDYLKRRTAELVKSEVTTPIRISDPFSKSDKDLFKRYLTYQWSANKYDKILDEHFLIIISGWLTEICQLK